MTSKVSVVLVNYNGWKDTIECLESLLKVNYSNFNIIVVDNKSTNDSLEKLINWAKGEIEVKVSDDNALSSLILPLVSKPVQLKILDDSSTEKNIADFKIIILKSAVNLGFAGGNNLGIKLALANNADFIWLLNNDTVVPNDSIDVLVTKFNFLSASNRSLGMLGSKLLYYHKPKTIQAIMGEYNPLTGNSRHIGMNEEDKDQYDHFTPAQSHYVVGASMFLPKTFIKEVGLMAEDYFLYYEEVDWLIRGREKGFTIALCPQSVVYHKEGASIGSNNTAINNKSELSDYYSITNKLKITKRYYSKYLPFVYLSYFPIILNRIKRKQFKRIPLITRIFIKSIFSNQN
ncbi:glycosyltransferase family 2 protein [Adhaeribacter swui]|uniref:Glycosyltransferase family 2 protein n=1 Tax=Adhaeribacter swui TaxID=2086471 RepID=A0A7G7GCV6_9BACT|nr:glycosyltransferase family 2 protein [Adhaeribacter swui]QNF34990.1 glycosyltransferase family 2 protein [Adhaeribacter swui]